MRTPTADNFQNVVAGLGLGTDNINSSARYTFNFITRNSMLCSALYRGSWAIQKAVNIVADDMTRAGIELTWPSDEQAPGRVMRAMRRLHIWEKINEGIRWARLFGGAIGIFMIDGHNSNTPLDVRKIGKGAFKGLHVFDRWMVTPSQEIVTDFGPHFGLPKFYTVNTGQNVPFSGEIVHHTRCVRFEGLPLPYMQRTAESAWGLSIIEPIYDRLVNFDTATAGTANLIHRAHLRTLKIKDLRQLIASGSDLMAAVLQQIDFIRRVQMTDGLTLLDAEDEMEYQSYQFGGVRDVIDAFSQQLAAAADIPATRYFGTSPGGLGSNGDAEMRNYYDKLNQDSERQLRDPLHDTIIMCALSDGLAKVPDDMDFSFNSLWQMSDTEKSDISSKETASILSVREAGLISDQQALRELSAMAPNTGMWGTITEEVIAAADDQIPDPVEMMQEAAKAAEASKTGTGNDPDPIGNSDPTIKKDDK